MAKSIGSKKFRIKGKGIENKIKKCDYLEKSFVLTVDGEIKPCCYLADDKEHYDGEPSISLKKYPFWGIMGSPYYVWMDENCKKLAKCNETCMSDGGYLMESL